MRTIDADEPKPGYTDRGRAALRLAAAETRALGHNAIDTEHLLLGTSRVDERLADLVLATAGLDVAALRQAIRAPYGTAAGARTGTADVVRTADMFAELSRADSDVTHIRCLVRPRVDCGITCFRPRSSGAAPEPVASEHGVICLVLQGRGHLATATENTIIATGDLCYVPARLPHDFVALEEPLVLLYLSVEEP